MKALTKVFAPRNDHDYTVTIPPGLFMEADPDLVARMEQRKKEMGNKWIGAKNSAFQYSNQVAVLPR